jgi:hypothetical protein
MAATVSPGLRANISAAAPATCGEAMDVPDSKMYSPSCCGYVDPMFSPGAPRSTETAPKFEKPARVSLLVVAATQTTLLAV